MREPRNIEECVYFARKQLFNDSNEAKGSIMAWVLKGEEDRIYLKYTCPFCNYRGELSLPNIWKRKRMEGKYREVVEFTCEACGRECMLVKEVPKRKRYSRSL
ncbi:MAG: hypothetical protein QW507_01475 [Candidatus Nanoarchaeia archaeon]|nr:hypothetical protein [Candidatus Haiyanarchaeum thermophilum]MCW1303167.1 hypothetical protein [Candidatus Haiyanarchaeum thermophilum]MCW1303832.1 hypothetical protein [Candidatus Haiyanarchaeum thermophilum]MCW1306551.1 hypothetical protein [Candidatus Haiyanarchaeum thermophilum]MCW1306965.1 hypothetical protein [Candidatus Haiyanarchaeum thermophilum]